MDSLPQKIAAAVDQIFATMVMMEITAEESPPESINPLQQSITGMIGLAGTHRGMLALHFPETLAKRITGNFLGLEVEEINEDVQDAIGELANMLGGSLKGLLSENGKDIKLSMPSTIAGEQYHFQSHDEGEAIVLPFTTEGARFVVELRLQQDD